MKINSDVKDIFSFKYEDFTLKVTIHTPYQGSGSHMKTSIICAMALNRGIGYKNTLPWRLSNDLQHFKALTMGKPIVMEVKLMNQLVDRYQEDETLFCLETPNLKLKV